MKFETVCECCWEVIQGDLFEVDDLTMCETCYFYHEYIDELSGETKNE